MIDFNAFIESIKKDLGIKRKDYEASLVQMLISNGWLDKEVQTRDGRLYASEEFINQNRERFIIHAKYYHLAFADKNRLLMAKLSKFAPQTASLWERYCSEFKLEDETIYILLDFLCYYLPGELSESTDREIGTLMENGFDSLKKVYGDILADYINWTKRKTKTVYFNDYYMRAYSDRREESSAYTRDTFLRLIYYLFNEEYIEKNDMYFNAAKSKNFVDTWLFLSLHCICALRKTDLKQIPHPRLTCSPEDVLEKVAAGTFSDAEAKACLYSIIYTLDAIQHKPHKTRKVSGVSDFKLEIPHSVEAHMGKLFAIAEAYNQLYKKDADVPLIRPISEYKQIRRYLGDDIGDLFIEANFHSRSANKSFLQMIYSLSNDALNLGNDDFHVKGYILASIARSHKGGFADYATTTSIYLRDANMNGLTPEFVARELMERGVLSCIADMLLKMICGEQYTRLSVENQTKAIQALRLNPLDIEDIVGVTHSAENQAVEIVKQIYDNNSKENILNLLHRLGNGEAASKRPECLCLITAMQKSCPHDERYHSCLGCEYEVSTKATMFLLLGEHARLLQEYEQTQSPVTKEKCRALAKEVIVPSVLEILSVMREQYGEDAVKELKEIIDKVNSDG